LAHLRDDPERLFEDPAVFAAYHQSLLQLGQGRQRSAAIQKARNGLEFEEVDRMFRVIEESGKSVVVKYGRAEKFIEECRHKGHVSREDRRQLQQYMVNIYMSSDSSLVGIAQPVVRGDESLLEFTGNYRPDVGLVLGEMSVEDCVV
jgi:hypothetical protein